jgi:hypothetical protein
MLVFTLLVVIQIIAPAPAQSPLLSEEMFREVCDEINSTTGSTATSLPPMSLPDAPVPQRAEVKVNVKVMDKKFIAVMAALGGAESLRFTTHKLVLDHEFAADAPWVTSVPANPHLVARYAAI